MGNGRLCGRDDNIHRAKTYQNIHTSFQPFDVLFKGCVIKICFGIHGIDWLSLKYIYIIYPSKHKTFLYHLYNVGPTSSTLVRHCINVIQKFCASWDFYNFNTSEIESMTLDHSAEDRILVRDTSLVFTGTSSEVGGIAVDWLSNTIYWTDKTYNWISMAAGDKYEIYRHIVATDLHLPGGICVHPMAGWVIITSEWRENANNTNW